MSDKTNSKAAKLLRIKAQEFHQSRRNSHALAEIMSHFESGSDTSVCLQVLEGIFFTLLRESQMYTEIVPLKVPPRTIEVEYSEWLRTIYDKFWDKILACIERMTLLPKLQLQALTTAMNLLEQEGRFPLEQRHEMPRMMPVPRLKAILTRVLHKTQLSVHLINKFQEFFLFDDILHYTWKSLPSVTAKINPAKPYIFNYLLLLERLPVQQNASRALYCCGNDFVYDERAAVKSINKIWNCVMQWEHTEDTHRQLLVVLLERVSPHLEKPLLMIDFLMDSLDMGGPIGMLALQGIFSMIQIHNLEYPDIFAKLYSMFEPEIFHTKFKARLFYLADMFLSSTHLPENLVAAFVKRLARLALVAPSQDVVVICIFICNLILRHPGLKCMLDDTGLATDDTYIMEERDPVKSNAIQNSLWELRSLQNHSSPKVALTARIINRPLPNVEWDITKYLSDTNDDAFDQEVKKNRRQITKTFDKPSIDIRDALTKYWTF